MGQALELVYDFIVDLSSVVEKIKKERHVWLAMLIVIMVVIAHSVSISIISTDWSDLVLRFLLPIRILMTLIIWVIVTGVLHFTAELLQKPRNVVTISQPTVTSPSSETVVLEHGLSSAHKIETTQSQPAEGRMVELFTYLGFGISPLMLLLPLTLIIRLSPVAQAEIFGFVSLLMIFWVFNLQTNGIRRIYGVTGGRATLIICLPFVILFLIMIMMMFAFAIGMISLLGNFLFQIR